MIKLEMESAIAAGNWGLLNWFESQQTQKEGMFQ